MKQARYSGIDALRTVGCILIAMMHIAANSHYEIGGFFYKTMLPSFADFVYLFLIVSAFGMCCGYFDSLSSGQFDTEGFYKRRFGKTWLFFALLVLLDIAMQRTPASLAEGFMDLTMVFGLLPNNQLSVIGVGWTLGLIFLFYLLFPFFVFLWNKKGRAWFALAVSLVISQLCGAYFFTEKFGITGMKAWSNILYSAPMFLSGGLLYLYRNSVIRFVKRFRWLWLAACVAMSVCYYLIPSTLFGLDVSVLRALLLFMPWLMYAISIDSPVLSNPVTKFVSGISMEIYLAHMVAFRITEKLGLCYLFGTGLLSYLITVLVTLGILIFAILLYKQLLWLITKKWHFGRKKHKNAPTSGSR